MAYIFYIKLWEPEFVKIVSKKDKVQDTNINQLKLEVHDTYKKDEKTTTHFEAVNDEDVINRGYLHEKILGINSLLSFFAKEYNEFRLQNNKQSVEEFLNQRAVTTTIQILYDKKFFDSFTNADKVLKDCFFVTRGRLNLEKVNDGVSQ